MEDNKALIVALDYGNAVHALEMARKLDPDSCRVKVGKELFTRSGPDIVKDLTANGFEVFLDLISDRFVGCILLICDFR